jgi:alpha-glucosidase
VSLANGTNLYGDHPVYFDHRGEAGTHAVFLLNSNGKDIKIDNSDGQFLEYNTLGGILDLYFLAG